MTLRDISPNSLPLIDKASAILASENNFVIFSISPKTPPTAYKQCKQ